MKAVLATGLLALAAVPASASAAFPGSDLTQLSGAPARNPAISQDRRFGRLVAFESGGNV